MKFVHPEILWALTALSIPIIVHLFNFRKFKKVLFPNVAFLREIKQETQSKSKLKHLLILFSRMLALSAIVFAFAQPFVPTPGTRVRAGGTAISLYIDNSFSMEGAGKDGRLLDLAKNKALEIVNSFSPSDKFQLLTSDFEGRHQRLVSREEMTDLIQEVNVSPVSRKMSEVASRQQDLLAKSGMDNRRAFILSDLQQSVTDISAVKNDTTIQVNIVPERAENISNMYVDSVWFDSPVRQLNQPEVLHARIVNTGNEGRENVALQLMVDGQQKSVATVNVSAESLTDVAVTYTNTEPGYKKCILKLNDRAIVSDDDYFFSYNVADQIRVQEIRGNAVELDAVKSVFSDDPYFNYLTSSENNVDFGAFAKQDFIILNQLKNISTGLISEIDKFTRSGGSILIIPASEIAMNEYNALLAKLELGQINGKMSGNGNGTDDEASGGKDRYSNKVSSVNYDHYIFKNAFEKTIGNVDLPLVNGYYEITYPSRSTSEPMMVMQSGSPFMLSNVVGAGRAYLTAVSLGTAESNFISHAFFPASLLRMAEFSQPASQLAYTLGKEQAIVIRNVSMGSEETFRLRDKNSGVEFIPDHRNVGGNTELYVHADMHTASNFDLTQGEKQIDVLSFNFDRAESDTRSFTAEAIRQAIDEQGWTNWSVLDGTVESIAASADELNDGKKYWFSMIVAALIFLGIEILLIKFWR